MNASSSASTRRPLSFFDRLLVLAALLLVSACADPTPDRQADVAAKGAAVIPFDLDRSTHIFATTDDGGVQTVRSDDGDAEQIRLIRAHLQEEAARFAQGDFHDPTMIHGGEMPGLHTLVMGADRVTIEYRNVEGGGEIRYSSTDSELVTAIHEWFGAQLSDHGEHAQGAH